MSQNLIHTRSIYYLLPCIPSQIFLSNCGATVLPELGVIFKTMYYNISTLSPFYRCEWPLFSAILAQHTWLWKKSCCTSNFGELQLKLNMVKNVAYFENCHFIADTIYQQYFSFYSVTAKYHRIEAKIIEISTLLHADFKKSEISKQLNVSKIIAHRAKQRLKASDSLKDRSQSRRPQVINQKAILKSFENDPFRKWQD